MLKKSKAPVFQVEMLNPISSFVTAVSLLRLKSSCTSLFVLNDLYHISSCLFFQTAGEKLKRLY